MKKVKFIYNPMAGETIIVDKLDEVIRIHQHYGYMVCPFRLDQDMNMKLALSDINDNYSYILIAGGDGSLDLLINTLMEMNVDLPIGVIPMGTANDYANYIGMPSDIEEALIQILESSPKKMDIGKINDMYFVNVASTGLFTDISQRTDSDMKNTIGKLAYYIKGIEQIPTFRNIPVKITSKEKNFEGEMYAVLVFNGRTAGNIDFAYNSKGDDGLLDVIIIEGNNLKNIIPLFAKFLRREHLNDAAGLIYFQTDKLKIESTDKDLVSDIDGERGPDFPLNIECVEHGITILGYKKYKKAL